MANVSSLFQNGIHQFVLLILRVEKNRVHETILFSKSLCVLSISANVIIINPNGIESLVPTLIHKETQYQTLSYAFVSNCITVFGALSFCTVISTSFFLYESCKTLGTQ